MCSEEFLKNTIRRLNDNLLNNCPVDHANVLRLRQAQEQEQFLDYKRKKSDKKAGGRTTGPIEWRRARGELGEDEKLDTETFNSIHSNPIIKEVTLEKTVAADKPLVFEKPAPKTKEELQALVTSYFTQITLGCSNKSCNNEYCKNSSKLVDLSKKDAAIKAVQWAKEGYSKICK